jgi:hypothetical protein
VLLMGFVHNWVTVLLVTFLLVRAGPNAMARYGDRVFFVALVGAIVAIFADATAPIWWYQPWRYHLVNGLYKLLGFIVVGLVLAAFTKPVPAAGRA